MKILPQLRFPDFANEGEWDSTPLTDLCELITKGTTPTTLGYSYTESGVNFIKIESILDGKINLQKAAFISNECNEALKRSQLFEDDILFSIAGALGVVTTVSKEILPANTNQALSIVRLKNKELKDYVKAFLKSNIITSEIEKIKAGAAQPNISLSQVASFNIFIPKKPTEQQKIASCLSSLDELITAHSQKLELLKDHKKGLMQNLFPQEGETVPKYRFKEFENDGEWVEEILGDVIKYFKGFAFQSKYYTSSGRRIIRVSDMGFDYIKNEENAIYINDGDANQYEKWQLKKDDLIITTVGSKPPMYDSLVGRTIIVESKDENALLNQNSVCLRANSKIAQGFLNILTKKSEYVNFIETIIRGNANQGSIALEDLFKYKFLKPKNPKEQQKIASCLSSLDGLITAQTEKIEQLKLHKKGLMQGLFPRVEG